ncbi:protein of unknown function [Cupriavidus neocaledonicus]|uniref:Uncharacterized protein n=1 Tax=Cupriavidus neocaledonicus TaxID=1040979 RepID=A0A375HBB2_9BURK|nr:protein of unknown function [Cupriavidus neocaledonicus]
MKPLRKEWLHSVRHRITSLIRKRLIFSTLGLGYILMGSPLILMKIFLRIIRTEVLQM